MIGFYIINAERLAALDDETIHMARTSQSEVRNLLNRRWEEDQ